jgi:hypothetical protein
LDFSKIHLHLDLQKPHRHLATTTPVALIVLSPNTVLELHVHTFILGMHTSQHVTDVANDAVRQL